MKCPNCGTMNPPGEDFCSNCGFFLDTTATAGSATILSTMNPANTVTSSTLSGSGSSGNSRTLTPNSRLQNGRYIIEKILGQGGMGAALLAKDTSVANKLVVIKELISDNTDPVKRQEDVRNFKREVETVAQIDHPLVPNVTDSFQEGTRYFMVQEYVAGENLEDHMEHVNQPMPEREALNYASQLLDVLDYLEQQKPPIVHRDIKPANIIIGAKDKRAHLVDFGIARADEAKNAKKKQTSALGTPGYAPPEQYQGNADTRSDIYALAATLHHLLTNRDPRNYPPFAYPSVRSLNPKLSPEIDRILTRALTIDSSKRYQTAAAMKQDIDDILLQNYGVGNTSTYTLGASGPISTPNRPATNAPTQAATNYPRAVPPPPPPPARPPQQVPQRAAPVPPPPAVRNRQPQAGAYANPPARPQRRGFNWVTGSFLLLLLVLLLIAGLIFVPSLLRSRNTTTSAVPTATPTLSSTIPANGIGVTLTQAGESIGISDGSFAFDTGAGRTSVNVMIQAATAFKNGDSATAQSLWTQAVSGDTSNAEALIYLENQRVLASGNPHITLVVATMLTGDNVGVGRDDLQGAYIAQKAFNDGHMLGNVNVVMLIANAGSATATNANVVSQQIVKAANADKTIVGVMGWPFSAYAVGSLPVFSNAQIPIVSQTASTDALTGRSPYFFRVAPSNQDQATVGAQYAYNTLKARSVALFQDPGNSYSQSLASDFSKAFTALGGKIAVTETYTVGQPASLSSSLDTALKNSPAPDLIYFSGYSNDVSTILTNLPGYANFPKLKVMGGDALYNLGGYPTSARAGFNRLLFTSFAYPDEWGVFGYSAKEPVFFQTYADTYDPNRQHTNTPYGFTRPSNNVMLSYDATLTLLSASKLALSGGKTSITPNDLKQALTQINGANAVQGVSGQISLGADGNPQNKTVVFLAVSPEGFIQMQNIKNGTFLK